PRPERRPLRPDRRLGHVLRGDRRIALEAELELHLSRVGELPTELAELLLGVAADRVADHEVLALHLEPHAFSFSSREPLPALLNLADRPREVDDLNPACASP